MVTERVAVGKAFGVTGRKAVRKGCAPNHGHRRGQFPMPVTTGAPARRRIGVPVHTREQSVSAVQVLGTLCQTWPEGPSISGHLSENQGGTRIAIRTAMRTLSGLFSLVFGCAFAVAGCSGRAVEPSNASAGSGGSGASSGAGGAGASSGAGGAGASSGAGGAAAGTSPGGSAGAAGAAPHGGAGGGPNHEPAVHRASATPCDHTRPSNDPGAPMEDAGVITCHSHADCTAGENGRCGGNGHDGWHCTYDACFADSDCPTAASGGPQLCACEGGFRSDNNVCIEGNCRLDTDCGVGGFCSPSLGSCGHFTPFVGYYCHTKDDECADDSDCGADGGFGSPYCAFMPTIGHWQCASTNCVG